MFFSIILYIAGNLLIYVGRNQAACLLVGLVITGLGIYGIFGITFAMQPNVIDYSEYRKNASVAGLIAAFWGFFRVSSEKGVSISGGEQQCCGTDCVQSGNCGHTEIFFCCCQWGRSQMRKTGPGYISLCGRTDWL